VGSTTGLPELAITSYAAAVEALRSPNVVRPFDPASLPFRGRTALGLDGPEHTTRRRALNQLLRRDGHRWFREQVLYPTVERNLAAVLACAEEGVARADLVEFGLRTFLQLAAALAGLTGAATREGADELFGLLAAVQEAVGVDLYPPEEHAQLTARGLAAKEALRERFFLPALREHAALAAQVDAGELDQAALPHDLLTLVVRQADPAFADEDLALREVIQMLVAGTETSVTALTHAVYDLDLWLRDHPEDRPLLADPLFLLGAVRETLRLHPVTPVLPRDTIAELELAGGLRFPSGARLALDPQAASTDEVAFGASARAYYPRREVPRGVYAYGLAFGSGPHMCWGLPLVLGSEGTDGSQVHLLQRLYAAGMEPDPAGPPVKERGRRDVYASFPVVFRARCDR
jgi:cytochrome P450